MNIVTVLGSPRGMKGNTGGLLAKLIESAKGSGAEVRSFSLADMTVKPCISCEACHKTGKCPIEDDFETIKNAMLDCDGIVLASPNYILSVTAQMKALMDRCSGLLHCQSMRGRYGAAVVTSGSGGAEVEEYILKFLRILGCWTVGSAGADGAALANDESRDGCYKKAQALGLRLTKAIREKAVYPEQEGERDAFFQRMKQLVQIRRVDWPYEYNYWKSRGDL